MTFSVLTSRSIARRQHWVSEIVRISGHFGQDVARVETELSDEFAGSGIDAILDHLRLCGTIPESFQHDSSEEKLYSKYTDALIALVFRILGLNALLLTERADVADVEVVGANHSFVADAKAFRLSRTAKNQKDFKVEAMHRWKWGKSYALVVCPLHQLPRQTSQIYEQAIARDVCILSYSHLAVLLSYSGLAGTNRAQDLLGRVLASVASMVPSKSALAYWAVVNQAFIGFDPSIQQLWGREKVAHLEAIAVAKEEGLAHLATIRESLMALSHADAIKLLIATLKIDGRMRVIASCRDNGILDL